MKLYLIDVEWNHKGSHYLKKHHARAQASSAPIACRMALKEAREAHPRSIREIAGARFYFTVTVVDSTRPVEGGG